MSLNGVQLERHRANITGSKVASILSLPDAYESKFSLFSKMRGYTPWPEIDNERLRAGNHMEKCLHSWCTEEYDWNLVEGPEEGKYHPEYSFLYGLVDRLMVDGGKPVAVVEFKNVDKFMEKFWEEGPPEKFKAQVYFYNMLYNLPTAWIVACFGGNHFERYEIPRNQKIEAFILNECLKFWEDLQTDRWPEPDGSEDCAKALSALYDSHGEQMIVGSSEHFDVAREYDELSAEIRGLEKKKDLCANQLRNVIGFNQGIIFSDGSRATWKMTVPKKEKFDVDLFAHENPDIYQEYCTMPTGYRRLNVSLKEIRT